MTYYKTRSWSKNIEPIEIIRASGKSVYFKDSRGNEKRAFAHTGDERYFKSFEEAKQHLIERTELKLRYAKENLDRLTSELSEINSLTAPLP